MLKLIVFVLLIICTQLPAQTLPQQCNTSELSEDASADTALSYLKQDRQNLTSECIIRAIGIIREANHTPAIPILIKYLDFSIPSGISYDPYTQQPTGGLYPAVDVLARFGDYALPALKSAVKNEDLSKTARLNAEQALFVINKEPQMLKFFVETAQASQYPDVAAALTKFAKEAAQHCKAEERQQCSDAVNQQ